MLPPDMQYCIDSAVELAHLSPEVGTYYYMYYNRGWKEFDDALEDSTVSFEALLKNVFNDWYAKKATPDVKDALFYSTVKFWGESGNKMVENTIVSKFINTPIEDITEESVTSIFETEIRKIKSFYGDMLSRNPWGMANIANGRVEYDRRNNFLKDSKLGVYSPFCRHKGKPPAKRTKRNIKKALVKADSMLTKIAGANVSKLLVTGNSVIVDGSKFRFEFIPVDYKRAGYGGLKISLYDLKGTHITNLCTYFENVYPAEQVASFIMMINCGLELEIIENSNFYACVVSEAKKYPELSHKVEQFNVESNDIRAALENIMIIDGRTNELAHNRLNSEYSNADNFRQRFEKVTNLTKMVIRQDDVFSKMNEFYKIAKIKPKINRLDRDVKNVTNILVGKTNDENTQIFTTNKTLEPVYAEKAV